MKSLRGYIFTAVCLCVRVCVSVCVCVCVSTVFLWTKFQPNGCTDLDAVFAEWLLIALAQIQMKLVTLDQSSGSQWHVINFTPPRNLGGVLFSLQFVCLCVSPMFSCLKNSSWTDEQIWTQFSLNGCLPHWLKPYWNLWPYVKGQGHGHVISIFSS